MEIRRPSERPSMGLTLNKWPVVNTYFVSMLPDTWRSNLFYLACSVWSNFSSCRSMVIFTCGFLYLLIHELWFANHFDRALDHFHFIINADYIRSCRSPRSDTILLFIIIVITYHIYSIPFFLFSFSNFSPPPHQIRNSVVNDQHSKITTASLSPCNHGSKR